MTKDLLRFHIPLRGGDRRAREERFDYSETQLPANGTGKTTPKLDLLPKASERTSRRVSSRSARQVHALGERQLHVSLQIVRTCPKGPPGPLLSEHQHLLRRRRLQLFQHVTRHVRPRPPPSFIGGGLQREGAFYLCQRWSNRENEYRMCPGRANDDVSVKLKTLPVK